MKDKKPLSESAGSDKNRDEEKDLPGYPEKEDLFENEDDSYLADPDDLPGTTTDNDDFELMNEKDFDDDVSGEDLDVPGSELDDEEEEIGSEDEENNYYSLGGDDHDDLEEDRGDGYE